MQSIELKPGQLVELDLEKSDEEVLQFRTLIEDCVGDTEFTLLAPMYKAMPYPFREQDDVDLVFIVHDEEHIPQAYVFKAKVMKRYRRGDLSYLRIARVSGAVKLQRRGYYRLRYVADMNYEVLDEGTDQEPSELRTVITRDISAGGFRGIVTENIPVGALIRIHLDLGKEPFLLDARVVSSDRVEDSILRYEIRGQYSGLSTKMTGHLIQAINRVQSEYIRRMAATSLEERLASYGHGEPIFSERRRRRDWVIKWLDWSVVFSLLLAFLIFVNFMLAMPERPNSIDRYYGYPVRLEWDVSMIRRNIYFILMLFVVANVSLILNFTRVKRQEDHYRYSLVVMGGLSLVLILTYILYV